MSQISTSFNVLTGFIEVYSPDAKFTNDYPYKALEINSFRSSSTQNTDQNEKPKEIRYLNSVEISSSFKTLTDTCSFVVPRVDNWQQRDDLNLDRNNFSLFDPQELNNEAVFSVGNIVRVFLGYDFQDKLMFHGYVTEVSNTSPVKVKLEDGSYLLKQKVVNGIFTNPESTEEDPKDVRLSDFIDEVLDGTGVELHPSVEATANEITFGKYFQAKQSTPARIMKDIKDRGLSVFFEMGKLIIGRTYFDSSLTPHISSISNDNYKPPLIHNEKNVPQGGNKLETTTMNKKRNMVTVQQFIGNNRLIQLNVALDPNSREDVFLPIAISDSKNKGSQTKIDELNNWLTKTYNSSVDSDGYSQITATMNPIKKAVLLSKNGVVNSDAYKKVVDTLFEHGKDMFWKYFDSGLSGSVTTFGDYGLQSAQSVNIYDPRNPESAGEYLITDVKTNWGFNTGYRQNLKVGIKIKDGITNELLKTYFDDNGSIQL